MSVEDNVRQKRETLGITRQIVANTLGITIGSLDNKLYNNRKFTITDIKKLSILFNCSTDELLK